MPSLRSNNSSFRSSRNIDMIKSIQEKNTRKLRKLPRVNYANMDMNEDDIGEFNVCKRSFENGNITYNWKKVPLSLINEYGDEDYTEE